MTRAETQKHAAPRENHFHPKCPLEPSVDRARSTATQSNWPVTSPRRVVSAPKRDMVSNKAELAPGADRPDGLDW